jgi:hypothetical protein
LRPKKQKQAMFFSSLRFQLFVDLFVIATGFEPVTVCLEEAKKFFNLASFSFLWSENQYIMKIYFSLIFI